MKSFWKIALLCILFFAILIIIFLRKSATRQLTGFEPTPTPIPILYTKQTYSDVNQHIAFDYPADWTRQDNNNPDSGATFTFNEAGKSYLFNIIAPVGNTFPEAGLMGADSIDNKTVSYGGKMFIRKLYLSQGNPIFVFAAPNQSGFSFYNFSMELPPTNTQKYIQIFDQILNTIQINKNFDPNELLNPSPSVTDNTQ